MLKVSEEFFSIQGEGPYIGQPALFLRLSGCNLLCGGPGSIESKKPEAGATWRCDTIEVWLKGNKTSNTDLIKHWYEQGWTQQLKEGAHLIITGGEPLLQQDDLITFLKEFKETKGFLPFIEIETNGTIVPRETLFTFKCHFNVSPKLENSGMPIEKCINSEAITRFKHYDRSIFKFVVSNEKDIIDSIQNYSQPHNIPKEKIILMPGASDRKTLQTLEQDIIALSIKHSLRYSTRLHILIWDQKTGV